jgi:flagellar biosynthesis/type III secretory pathway protein FliH
MNEGRKEGRKEGKKEGRKERQKARKLRVINERHHTSEWNREDFTL